MYVQVNQFSIFDFKYLNFKLILLFSFQWSLFKLKDNVLIIFFKPTY